MPSSVGAHAQESANMQKTAGDIINTNFPMDAEGRVYHLALKKGEMAKRMLIVGAPDRADLIALKYLKPDPNLPECFPHSCVRGFKVYTGFFEGKKVSIVSTGMGTVLIDFFVREANAITSGQRKIIRLGSCGSPHPEISVGTVVAATKAVKIVDDQRPWEERKATGTQYTITNPAYPDKELHQTMVEKLKEANAFPVYEGTTATADSFYSSQGRIDPSFPDQNEHVIEELENKYPDVGAISMEAYHLFNLANMNTDVAEPGQGIKAAACKIVLAARKAGVFITNEEKHKIELSAGKACLKALVA